MKTKILAIFGIILGMAPIYSYLGWLYVCISFPEISHEETVAIFDEKILFGIEAFSTTLFSILIVFSGLISIMIFSFLLFKLSQIQDKNLSQRFNFILCWIYIIIVGLFTTINLWGLL